MLACTSGLRSWAQGMVPRQKIHTVPRLQAKLLQASYHLYRMLGSTVPAATSGSVVAVHCALQLRALKEYFPVQMYSTAAEGKELHRSGTALQLPCRLLDLKRSPCGSSGIWEHAGLKGRALAKISWETLGP